MMFSFSKSGIIPVNTIALFAVAALLLTIALCVAAAKKYKTKRKKIMIIWIFILFIGASALFFNGTFGRFVDVNTASSKMYTSNQLTQDLQQLEKLIVANNPMYFTDEHEIKQSFKEANSHIKDEMTELEFYRLINPIVKAIGCGHTNLSVSEALSRNREMTAKYFPLKVTLIGNDLYTLEDDPANGINAGDKIISINGRQSSEIINSLLDNISGDSTNEAKPRYIISKHFNSRFYDYIDSSDGYDVVMEDKANNLKTVYLQGAYRKEFNTTAWSLHFADYTSGDYYDKEIYDDYAVLTIRIFLPEKNNKFDTFFDEFFSDLDQLNITKLVIDLRGNFGADPIMAKTLLSHLVKEKIEYFEGEMPFSHKLAGYTKPVQPSDIGFDGDIVVLTDGACFSTTAHLCSLLKYHGIATFVGTKTGGTYVCTDRSEDAVLNHTRIRLHYSTLTYKTAVQGIREDEGIEPDVFVSPSIDDILRNEDVQMEKGLSILGVEEVNGE